jgi:subtilase family serine protease
VGGTSLYIVSARGRYFGEVAWGGGGGGVSTQYARPAFQTNNNVLFARRSEPDVSMIADPGTGVPIIDSADGIGWAQFGGTSLSSPVFAGVIALAQEVRINSGLLPLNSVQINSRMYAAYNSASYLTYFHDVTVGNNGFAAGTGYDLATGIGSPKADTLVGLLAAP